MREFPDGLAGFNIEGAENLLGLVVGVAATATALIIAAGLPLGRDSFRVDGAALERVDVEKFGGRIVRCREEVCGSLDGGADELAFGGGNRVEIHDGPAIGGDFFGPSEFLH